MPAIEIRRPGEPAELRPVERPDPVPTGDEVLVRDLWIGVNYVDLQHCEGRPYRSTCRSCPASRPRARSSRPVQTPIQPLSDARSSTSGTCPASNLTASVVFPKVTPTRETELALARRGQICRGPVTLTDFEVRAA
jgi:hypothetical protein